MVAKVFSVNKVWINLSSGTLLVAAEGTVNSSGWTNPELGAWVYVEPPPDGVQDFDFLATPPKGPVLTVMCPIAASFRGKAPKWLKGVRVHSSSGNMEAMLDDKERSAEVCTFAEASDPDDPLPWPL